ncbi:tetratricopeptide repeat protein [Bizionia myxarmorum]|uniref:Uncharacterized protein n=1 Tax=Bizionia myxarmorum TaxID=291186 RepID=A0A5D0R4H2_9FLAO|nr:tetratricopeptide repeat protein [Bizionia myxarmorum]TYB75766.1 hypothetical protein ES674_13135 [Bizionia myxarmorum]
MKKHFSVVLIIFLSFQVCFSQDSIPKLEFSTKYYDAVNEWVAFPKSPESDSYIYGYIYIDESAGFTFRKEDTFKVVDNTIITNEVVEPKTSLVIARLSKNTSQVSVLNETQKKALKLPEEPDWLAIYKVEDDVAYLKQIGYHYNHVSASHNALKPLLKAYDIEPNHDGLEFELGFAYNALQQFDKAIPVLEKAFAHDAKNQLLYKELGYAYLNSEQLEKAEIAFTKGIEVSNDDAMKCEMALNMSNGYFVSKNIEKFKEWAALTRKYASKTPQYVQYIEYFEKELEKL